MRDYSELQGIFLNDDFMSHLHEAIDWIAFAGMAVMIPVAFTTTHATISNYYHVSKSNEAYGKTESWDQSFSNILQSMIMTATGKPRVLVT